MSKNAWSSQIPITEVDLGDGLLDLMNRLTSVGGVLHVLDHVPERLESFVDLHRAGRLLGGRREISNLTAATGRVSMIQAPSLWCVPGPTTS